MRLLCCLLLAPLLHAGELHAAAAAGDAARVEELLNGGAEVNALDQEQRTPLQRAASDGTPEVVRLLLRNGANPNLAKKGLPPVISAMWRDAETAMILLAHGAAHSFNDHWVLARSLRRKGLDAIDADTIRRAAAVAYPFIVDVLWELGQEAVPLVKTWVRDESVQVRMAAAAVLGAYLDGDAETLHAISRALKDKDPAVRRLAIGACMRVKWPRRPKGELAEERKEALLALAAARKGSGPHAAWARAAYGIVKGNGELVARGHPVGRRARRAKQRKLRKTLAEPAVERGLSWLAQNQHEHGKWDSDAHGGGALYDVGVTGLALLALLGAGHAPGDGGPYAKNVSKGLRYLVTTMDDEGCVGTRSTRSFLYNHAIAALALCEAAMLTDHPTFRAAAEEAVKFMASAQNKDSGWGYEPQGGVPNTSITGWGTNVLLLGRLAGFEVDESALKGARKWLDGVTYGYSSVGYEGPNEGASRPEGLQDKFPSKETESLTAVGMLMRIHLGDDLKSKPIKSGVDDLLRTPPEWNPRRGTIDMYYWYHAAAALHYVGGSPWKKGSKALTEVVLPRQRKDGSWDPAGPWGGDGGRVYSTSLVVLSLEATYRHARGR